MKILMFGWEFPPNILGGLGTASYGLVKGLAKQSDLDITFVMPKPTGEEDKSFAKIVGASHVPIVWKDLSWEDAQQKFSKYMNPQDFYHYRDKIYADFNYINTSEAGTVEFSGRYPDNLLEEINNYSIVAGVIARSQQYDIVHSHDWLTYPAGVHAKNILGVPLVIHVHATDFDRSRGKVNPTVYSIEKNGMDHADHILCVSELTRQIVIDKYHQDPQKVSTLHNAVEPLKPEINAIVMNKLPKDKVVTFLGRITMQKGPEYFVEAAAKVLERMENVRFVMAGSGDMYERMMKLVCKKGISERFHFTGFLRGSQVYKILKMSDLYIMPSVSEPFGISPLEAMQCGVPTIISRQSGCSEILNNTIKIDYWDVEAMANMIYAVCSYPALAKYLSEDGKNEVDNIKWENVGYRLRSVYDKLLQK